MPVTIFDCTIKGCGKKCATIGGLRKHTNAAHHPITPEPEDNCSDPPGDYKVFMHEGLTGEFLVFSLVID